MSTISQKIPSSSRVRYIKYKQINKQILLQQSAVNNLKISALQNEICGLIRLQDLSHYQSVNTITVINNNNNNINIKDMVDIT